MRALLDYTAKVRRLLTKNKEAVDTYNWEILMRFLQIGGALMIVMICLYPFSASVTKAMPGYAAVFLIFVALFVRFRYGKKTLSPLWGLYPGFTAIFALAICLSIVNGPDQRATTMVGLLIFFPLAFIDRPERIDLFTLAFFCLHTVLSFRFKGFTLGVEDGINCLCFTLLGIFVGNVFLYIHLLAFDAQRRLILDKTTDVLTGLYNRRRLYEVLTEIQIGKRLRPAGVMMVDVDQFKMFNDRNGHAAGDQCLNRFGGLLKSLKLNTSIAFFRYGGEEFVGLVERCTECELMNIAQSLRIAVQTLDTGTLPITASIGTVWCSDEHVENFETWIDRADQAAYGAKAAGGDTVVNYSELKKTKNNKLND